MWCTCTQKLILKCTVQNECQNGHKHLLICKFNVSNLLSISQCTSCSSGPLVYCFLVSFSCRFVSRHFFERLVHQTRWILVVFLCISLHIVGQTYLSLILTFAHANKLPKAHSHSKRLGQFVACQWWQKTAKTSNM